MSFRSTSCVFFSNRSSDLQVMSTSTSSSASMPTSMSAATSTSRSTMTLGRCGHGRGHAGGRGHGRGCGRAGGCGCGFFAVQSSCRYTLPPPDHRGGATCAPRLLLQFRPSLPHDKLEPHISAQSPRHASDVLARAFFIESYIMGYQWFTCALLFFLLH